jgi:beta-fructofuranosidase
VFNQLSAVHLRPTDRQAEAWFGDPVPFYWDGMWHLFYVWDQGHLILPRVCHSWGHFASEDLVHWTEYPMAIDPGEEASCGTGTVMEHNGVFHLYYLGRYFTTNGVMHETMCHATSTDLITWHKDPNNPVSRPDTSIYSVKDWRDGFPFWNEETQEWWMLLTCSLKDGPEPFRGCIGLMVSKDLQSWEVREPYWTPYLGRHLECPDLFEWNGWWYLLFSGGYGHAGGTLYRRSRSKFGPWESVPVDTFDGYLFYAAKTASDGNRRMIFGWTGTRQGGVDTGRVQWGGHGLVRELWQDTDGYLWAKCPAERLKMGELRPVPTFAPQLGAWSQEGTTASVEHNYGLTYTTATVPKHYLFSCKFKPGGPETQRFGLLLRTDGRLTEGYRVAVEPHQQDLRFTSYGAENKLRAMPATRPLPCSPEEEFTLTVFVSDAIVEVFVNDQAALACRCYDHTAPELGLFVEEGSGTFYDMELRELPAETW